MLEYLKSHIIEEIEGGLDYMEKAIAHKGTDWGCMFRRMAEMEFDHANHLTKMFNSYDKPDNVTDEAYAKMHKEIMTSYIDSMTKFEAMKKIYWTE